MNQSLLRIYDRCCELDVDIASEAPTARLTPAQGNALGTKREY